ncbi:MAG: Molybdopterin-guanine dinucleotide biosynthesis protein [Gemmatimonadetes bacterium]|nr:Molybdopterin-guanine dinucleotide biosynthesis protein [Gemmatimonadota bacterium]
MANDARAAAWFPDRRIIRDVEPGLGPLGGLATAIAAGVGAPVIVVAWDMPYVSGALLQSLRRRGELAMASVVPMHGTTTIAEPLCAYYLPDALSVAEGLVATGERRARALYEALAVRGSAVTMSDRALERFGDAGRLFLSVDSPSALAAIGGEPPERAG